MAMVTISTFEQTESTGTYSPANATVGYRVTNSATGKLIAQGAADRDSPDWTATYDPLPAGILLKLTVEANDGETPHSTFTEATF